MLAEVGEFLRRLLRRAIGELAEALVVDLARGHVRLDFRLVALVAEGVPVVERAAAAQREQHARRHGEQGGAGMKSARNDKLDEKLMP